MTRQHRSPKHQEAAAWRMIGDAFVQLVQAEQGDALTRRRARSLAEWLHDHMLTPEQQHEFMIGTGWIFDADLAAELQGDVQPDTPPRRGRQTRAPNVPF